MDKNKWISYSIIRKNGLRYLMVNQYDKEIPFTYIPKWKSIASGCSFLSQLSYGIYRMLLLIKTYSSKESPFWFFWHSLKHLWRTVTVSLGIQNTLWSSSLVLYELCHLLGHHLSDLLSQLVGWRNMQDLKSILDLSNVLKSSKFWAVNLVKDSFYLPPPMVTPSS